MSPVAAATGPGWAVADGVSSFTAVSSDDFELFERVEEDEERKADGEVEIFGGCAV